MRANLSSAMSKTSVSCVFSQSRTAKHCCKSRETTFRGSGQMYCVTGCLSLSKSYGAQLLKRLVEGSRGFGEPEKFDALDADLAGSRLLLQDLHRLIDEVR